MSCILEKLWIGSYENACNEKFVQDRGITHMMSCAGELSITPAHCLYKMIQTSQNSLWFHIPVTADSFSQELYLIGAKKIDEWLSNGHTVLLYSSFNDPIRSISTVLTYLILYKNLEFSVAYTFLKQRITLEDPSTYTSAFSLAAGDTGATAE